MASKIKPLIEQKSRDRKIEMRNKGAEYLGSGHLRSTLINGCIAFKDVGIDKIFRFNEFSNEIECHENWDFCRIKKGDIINDDKVLNMRMFFSEHYSFNIQSQMMYETIAWHARQNGYNPILDWLSELTWDGKKRVETFLIDQRVCADNKYNRWLSSLILGSAIKRVMSPGCQYDYMVILEGKQGIGKSRTIEALAGKGLSTIMSLTDRDQYTVQKMQGAWFIEVAEMPFLNKKDMESMKAFITTSTDKARFPWDKSFRTLPRQNVFIGTINPDQIGYLNDSENRRFLPLLITKHIDVEKIKADREQLFAEALMMYMNGFKLYTMDKDLLAIINRQQEDRMIHDEWETTLDRYLKHKRMSGIDYVTTRDFYLNKEYGIGGFDKDFHAGIGRRINRVFNKLGLTRTERMRYLGENAFFFDIRPYDRNLYEPIEKSTEGELRFGED